MPPKAAPKPTVEECMLVLVAEANGLERNPDGLSVEHRIRCLRRSARVMELLLHVGEREFTIWLNRKGLKPASMIPGYETGVDKSGEPRDVAASSVA